MRNRFEDDLVEAEPYLLRQARKLTRHSEEAKDLVQQTMLLAWKGRDSFQPDTNFRAWLATILRNAFLDLRRKENKQRALNFRPPMQEAADPEQDVILEFEQTRKVMEKLSPNHQRVLMLVGIQGESYQEAADAMGTPVGTVRSRLSRARENLFTQMKNTERRRTRRAIQ